MIGTEHLIIFTRYPEAGRTKTRLIPAVGAQGAAQVQRQMAEHAMVQVRRLMLQRGCSVEVRFAGGDRSLMQAWLGPDMNYQPQGNGDLGTRMAEAIATAFSNGAEQVVIIGTDCPQVDVARLSEAFDSVRSHDLVLGPAMDGGYYLLGLRRMVPEVFVGVEWSTDRVLSQTVAIAQSLQLDIAYLEKLSDIDRPEDLSIWDAVQTAKPRISVILPVLNEAGRISDTLAKLPQTDTVEVIVVDGGSSDTTVAEAQAQGVKVLSSEPGRSIQMNAGARIAAGEILLFLHADTQLPEGFADQVQQTLEQPEVVAGAFDLAIAGAMPGLRWVEWGVRWRSRLFQLPYGDQALFLKAETFRQIGGFAELPIMEDFELVQRLRRLGRVAIAPASVLTSARRWDNLGIWRTTLINQVVILAYFLGVPIAQIARLYRGK